MENMLNDFALLANLILRRKLWPVDDDVCCSNHLEELDNIDIFILTKY